MGTIDKIFMKNLFHFRKTVNNLTQEQLAERCGCSKQTIQNYEAGRIPDAQTIEKIAQILNVLPYQLFLPDKAPERTKTVSQLLQVIDDQEKRIEEQKRQLINLQRLIDLGQNAETKELLRLWAMADHEIKDQIIGSLKIHLDIGEPEKINIGKQVKKRAVK
jgi:transcriptional regulator with XRE-family HTH domain